MVKPGLSTQSLLILAIVISLAIYKIIAWIRNAQPPPNPWSHEIDEKMEDPEVQPLCPRCLTPHPDEAWFCPECGLAASATTNLSPFLYIFSLGDAFRAFTSGRVPVRPLTIIGYLLVSAAEFPFFPLYWFLLFWSRDYKLRHSNPPATDSA